MSIIWADWRNWVDREPIADLLGVAGFGISIIGFSLSLWKLRSLQSAVNSAVLLVARVDLVEVLSRCELQLRHLKNSLSSPTKPLHELLSEIEELREAVVLARAKVKHERDELLVELQRLIREISDFNLAVIGMTISSATMNKKARMSYLRAVIGWIDDIQAASTIVKSSISRP